MLPVTLKTQPSGLVYSSFFLCLFTVGVDQVSLNFVVETDEP